MQPDSVGLLSYRIRMNKHDSRKALGESLRALMRLRWGGDNLTQLGKQVLHSSAAQAVRVMDSENNTGVKTLDLVADHFDVQPWQLLVPGFDAASPPALAQPGTAEAFFSAELLERLQKESPEGMRKIENVIRAQVELDPLPRTASFTQTTGAETPAQKSTYGLPDPIAEPKTDRRSPSDRRTGQRKSA